MISLGRERLIWFPPGRWGQTPPDKTWKYVCLAVFLTLLLMLIILCVVLSKGKVSGPMGTG